MKRFLFLIVLFLSIPCLSARQRDSLTVKESERFRFPQLIVPGALMTLGAIGVDNPWFEREINGNIQSWAGRIRQDRYVRVEDYLQYLPIAAYALAGPGERGEHDFVERALALTTAWLALGVMVNTVKYTVRDVRPDVDTYNSFPSGHTATAFMGAELVRKEYGPLWGGGAYLIAAGTGFFRIYNNRHWFNDILGGAAIGILSANIGYWLLPLERSLFPHNNGSLSLVPCVGSGPGSVGYGLALSWVF